MNKPVRVQLSRTKGWRMPPNTVSVARPGKWGNTYVVGSHTAEDAVARYRADLLAGTLKRGHDDGPFSVADAIRDLRGKNLACWCKGSPCHADVLLELANAPQPTPSDGGR